VQSVEDHAANESCLRAGAQHRFVVVRRKCHQFKVWEDVVFQKASGFGRVDAGAKWSTGENRIEFRQPVSADAPLKQSFLYLPDQLKSLDVTAFRGQKVRIFFSSKEDQGSLTSFIIDNVKLAIE